MGPNTKSVYLLLIDMSSATSSQDNDCHEQSTETVDKISPCFIAVEQLYVVTLVMMDKAIDTDIWNQRDYHQCGEWNDWYSS